MDIYYIWWKEGTGDRDVLRVGERTRVLRGPQGDLVADIPANGKPREKSRDTLGREVIVQKGGFV